MFSILRATALALALVSTLLVDEVTVKGPSDELAAVSLEKLRKFNVTCVLPVWDTKSGNSRACAK